jgi:hypothetical protein
MGGGSGSSSFDFSKYTGGMSGGAGSSSFDFSKYMAGGTKAKAADTNFAVWTVWMKQQSSKSWKAWCAYMCRQNDKQGLDSKHTYTRFMQENSVKNWKQFAKYLARHKISTFNAYRRWTSQHAVLVSAYDWESFIKAKVAKAAATKKPSLQCSFVKCPPGKVCEMGMCKPKGAASGFMGNFAPGAASGSGSGSSADPADYSKYADFSKYTGGSSSSSGSASGAFDYSKYTGMASKYTGSSSGSASGAFDYSKYTGMASKYTGSSSGSANEFKPATAAPSQEPKAKAVLDTVLM